MSVDTETLPPVFTIESRSFRRPLPVDRGGFGVWKTDEKIIAAEFRFLMDSGAVPYDEDVAFALDYLVHDFDDPTVNAALFMAWKEWKAPPAMDTADRGRNRDASLLAYIDKYRRFAIIIAEKGKNGNTG